MHTHIYIEGQIKRLHNSSLSLEMHMFQSK